MPRRYGRATRSSLNHGARQRIGISFGGKMLRFPTIPLAIVVSFTAGCMNPLNQATSDRYAQSCAEAERNGQRIVAEQACYRALVNVDWGHLGEHEKSKKMYNLARIKRQLEKYDEAEQLLRGSMELEEKQTPASKERIGRRLAEMAMVYGEQQRYLEGLPYVERLIPLADIYQGNEKRTVALIFYVYSQELPKDAPGNESGRLATKAVEMGFDPKMYQQ